MPKCTPIDRNQVNAIKIIDEQQGRKVHFSRFNKLLPKIWLCDMAELRKRK